MIIVTFCQEQSGMNACMLTVSCFSQSYDVQGPTHEVMGLTFWVDLTSINQAKENPSQTDSQANLL